MSLTPEFRASQFEAAQVVLEALSDADTALSSHQAELKDEALEIVAHVMRNGLRPPLITEAGEIVPS